MAVYSYPSNAQFVFPQASGGGGMDWSVPIDADVTAAADATYSIGSDTAYLLNIYTYLLWLHSGSGVVFKDATSNTLSLVIPNALDSTYTFKLPSNPGTNGYVLSTDGAGNTSW